jgi:hypothetical protein
MKTTRWATAPHTVALHDMALIRVDRDLSKLNRQLHREGKCYKVKLDVSRRLQQKIYVWALRCDWSFVRAYQLAYKMFREHTKEERANGVSRWHDFKIDLGLGETVGNVMTLNPIRWEMARATQNVGGTPIPYLSTNFTEFTAGEFEVSQVNDTQGTMRKFTLDINPPASYINILEEFENRGAPNTTPTTPETNQPYAMLNDEINDDTGYHLQEDGNEPPYHRTEMAKNYLWELVAVIDPQESNYTSGYFMAPLGAVVLSHELTNTSADLNIEAGDIMVEVAKGSGKNDYKGVYAEDLI